MLGLSALKRMYRQEPLARDTAASWENGAGGSYRHTLEIVSPFNYNDGVDHTDHTEPIVEVFFFFFDGIRLTNACGGAAPHFHNVQDRM